MKTLVTILFLLSCSEAAFSQVTWGTPITVTTSMGSNRHPRIALNRAGNPYILWGETDTRAYFSKWNGTGFTAPIVPSGPLTIFAQSWAGPDLAAFGDTVYVSMKVTPEMTTTAYTYLAHSYDGGTSFSAPVRVDNIGADFSRFPVVSTTAAGNPIVSFMRFDAVTMANPRYVVARSSDGGATFLPDVQASASGSTVCDCCPAALISSGSNLIMLYRNNASDIRDIWAGVSNDGGMTFPGHMNIDNNNWLFPMCPSNGPDGFVIGDTLYTVFRSGSPTSLVYLSRSSIGGMSSASTTAITGVFTGLTSQDVPRIANSGNDAMAVWVQNTTTGKYIAYSFTTNISTSFSGYSALPGATGSGLQNADVAMTPGTIHIVWEDDNTGTIKYVKGTYIVPASTPVNTARERISVYPNPSNDYITVSLAGINKMTYSYLADITGKKTDIIPMVSGGNAVFSVKGMAAGSYYLVIGDDFGKTYYSKITVK